MKYLFRAIRLPIAPVLVVTIGLLSPLLFSGKAMFWGTPMLQFVPWWSWAWETLRSGNLPLWNPLLGMGAPLIANYQSGLFYPPNWLYLLLYLTGGVARMAWGQALLVVIHLVWAGMGMIFLVRRLGLSSFAQTIGGLAFALSSYIVARAGFLSINSAIAWLPWIIWGLTPHNARERFSRKQFLGLVICLSMQLLAGHAQTTWYTWLLAGMWVGFWAWNDYDNNLEQANHNENRNFDGFRTYLKAGKRITKSWGKLLIAMTFACMLVAVQILPTIEYLSQSQRSQAIDYNLAMTYSFWPWHLLTLVAPNLFGNPAQGDYWGYANYWEDAIYIGILPLLLALGAVSYSVKRKSRIITLSNDESPCLLTFTRRFVWFLLFLFLLALILALGDNTPIFPWFFRHIPTFGLFQAPARAMIWAIFALVLLAARGADIWRRPEGRTLYWTRLGTAGALAVTLGAGLAWYFMGDISPTFIRASALAGLWGVGSGLLSLVAPLSEESANQQPEKRWGYSIPLWQYGVVGFVAADLLVAGWGLIPGVDLEIYRQSPLGQMLRAKANGHRIYLSETEEQVLKFKRFLRFDTYNPGEDWLNLRAVMLPNLNILDGFPSVNNFDPMLPGRYVNWMEYLGQAEDVKRQAMLRLMDVGIVESVDMDQPYGVRYESLIGSQRLRWVPCARVVQEATNAWEVVTTGRIDFQNEVILESQKAIIVPVCSPTANDSDSQVTIVENRSPNHLTIYLNAPSSGWFLLSDVWYPGWQAWVDGKKVPIYRADYLFQAIPVEAGEHTVVFDYKSISFWSGAIISLVSMVGILSIGWRRGWWYSKTY